MAATVLGLALGTTAFQSGSSVGAPACWQTLLLDWRDGLVDRVYPVSCYRQALARLPEDLVMYSSAASDISRALAQRVARTPDTRTPAAARELEAVSGGGAPILALVAGALAVAVLAAGSMGAVLRRRKR